MSEVLKHPYLAGAENFKEQWIEEFRTFNITKFTDLTQKNGGSAFLTSSSQAPSEALSAAASIQNLSANISAEESKDPPL